MARLMRWMAIVAGGLLLVSSVKAQSASQEQSVLFENVRIFDGKSAQLSAPKHVLVEGNKITRISTQPIGVVPSLASTVIQGEGRTLMRG